MRLKTLLLSVCLLPIALSAVAQSPDRVRWDDSRPPSTGVLSQKVYSDGLVVKSVTADRRTVLAQLTADGKRLEVLLLVANNTDQNFDVLPHLVQVTGNSKAFKQHSPDRLAAEIEKKARDKAGWELAGAWFFLRNRTVTNSETTGTFFGTATATGPLGTAHGTAQGLGSATTRTETSAPNYQAQQWAYARGQERVRLAQAVASEIRQTALRANTLFPRGRGVGFLYFDFDKGAKEVVLRVPLGGVVYEIPFSADEVGR